MRKMHSAYKVYFTHGQGTAIVKLNYKPEFNYPIYPT